MSDCSSLHSSVIATEQPLYKPGDVITMCLMKRQRGSVIAQPVKLGENTEDITRPFNILGMYSSFIGEVTSFPVGEVRCLIHNFM